MDFPRQVQALLALRPGGPWPPPLNTIDAGAPGNSVAGGALPQGRAEGGETGSPIRTLELVFIRGFG